ncbi:zinc-dependent alcohol dehydrogenase family protein [Aspergillus affinis]|uniref:zinc-dependent alcohol dehydrogenase family protein n=1 Tax=Aspergillus affinis TaxID=1070780 RepID=UPI0022FE7468|nr:NAD(P)-binding protein [Aspergillus affinis]KAI9035554.1 NAD(P)-binding protein [Aspergillus affinis]
MSQTVIRIDGPQNSVRNLTAFKDEVPEPSKHEDNVVPCSDAAGVVVFVGEGVKTLSKGDRVISTFDPTNLYGQQMNWLNGHGGLVDGALREYFTIPAAAAVKLPESSPQSFSEWSTLVCTGVTAWNALYAITPLKPSQIGLALGTGGVPIIGLLLAKAAGCTTIITSSSDEKLEAVKSKFGFDFGVNYKTHPELSKEVLRLTNGEGVDYVLENGGSGTIAESINSVKMGGNVSVIGFLSQAKEMPDVAGLALAKGAVVRGVVVGSTQLLHEVVRFVTRKGLRLPVEKELGFSADEASKAYEYLLSGTHVGKVCIKVSE